MKYDLTWRKGTGRIEIAFPLDMAEYLPKLDNDTPIVRWLREDLEIDSEFNGEYLNGFGFGNGLYRELSKGMIIYSPRLPRYKMETCSNCKGSGRHDPIFGDEKCFCCNGTGNEAKTQWRDILILRANLKLLFEALNYDEYSIGKGAKVPDMRIKLTVAKPDMHSASIQIPFKETVLLWLQGISENKRIEIKEVNNAMIKAGDLMSKVREFTKHSFQTYCQNGSLVMNVPGNATGIYLGSFEGFPDTMNCHNMDTGAQQLSILAGLAQLHSMFREATADIGTKLMERQLNDT